MPNAFIQFRRLGAPALALALAACASQQPVVQAPAPEAEPDPAPVQFVVEQVPDRSFEADTLYALLVAEIAGSRNRYDIAVSNYVQQALATRDPGVTARAARIARLLSAHEAALEMARLWLELEPNNAEAHFIAGAELARAGRLVEAAQHSAFLTQQGEEGFFEAIAAAATQAGDEQTIQQLRQAYADLVQKYPDSASLYLGQSILLQHTGEFDAALKAAQESAHLEEDNYQAGLQEMRVLQAMGRTQEAQQGLARLVEQYPDNQRLRLQYARLLASSDLKTAQEQFKTLVEQSPGDPDFTFSLGLIQLERGLVSEAAGQFQTLANGGEHSNAAHYYLGQIAEQGGDLDMALHHYLQVEDGSEYVPAVMEAAQILVQISGVADAQQYLRNERAQIVAQSRDNLYLAEAELLNNTGSSEEALEVLNTGLAEFPNSVRLLYARALLLTQMDRLADAEQDLKHIIDLAPNNAAALNALGYTLADKTDRLEEAYGYIRAALDLEPNDAAILDSMGWVNYRLGHYSEALEFLRRAMETTPDHEIAAHLGEVLWVTGKRSEARDVWRAGLQLNAESPYIQETIERLDADLGERAVQ